MENITIIYPNNQVSLRKLPAIWKEEKILAAEDEFLIRVLGKTFSRDPTHQKTILALLYPWYPKAE